MAEWFDMNIDDLYNAYIYNVIMLMWIIQDADSYLIMITYECHVYMDAWYMASTSIYDC